MPAQSMLTGHFVSDGEFFVSIALQCDGLQGDMREMKK